MGSVLIRLMEQRLPTRRSGAAGLHPLTVIEEPSSLLRRSGPGGPRGSAGAGIHAAEVFEGLFAGIRAYGEGPGIAEQILARLVPDVINAKASRSPTRRLRTVRCKCHAWRPYQPFQRAAHPTARKGVTWPGGPSIAGKVSSSTLLGSSEGGGEPGEG